MSLLRSSKPEYKLHLPVSKKRISYTCFNLRSEKTLLLATQGGDPAEIAAAVINTINDHLRTDGIKAENLPQAEAELLILNMRAKSVGEKIDIVVTDPEDTSVTYNTKVNLTKVGILMDKDFSNTVTLSDGRVLKLNAPTLTTMADVDPDLNEVDTAIATAVKCFACLVDEDEVYNAADVSEEEIEEFLLDLEPADFAKITDEFFAKLPRLGLEVSVTRNNGEKMTVPVEGLARFL